MLGTPFSTERLIFSTELQIFKGRGMLLLKLRWCEPRGSINSIPFRKRAPSFDTFNYTKIELRSNLDSEM